MRTIILLTAILLGGNLMAQASQISVAKNGKSDYVIVIAKDAPAPDKYAAEELQKFLAQISGATLPILTDDQKLPPRRILIGESRFVHAAPVKINWKALGKEGLRIATVGDDLIIAGGKPRGTLYGVYAFLEEVLGCRWYSSKVSRIPKMKEVILGDLDITETPAFEYREPFYTDAFDADWAARNRCNSNNARLDAKRGGKIAYGLFVHTFYALVPPDKHFKDHPEYFSLIDGKRTTNGAQLCLSNPAVAKVATEGALDAIKKNPDATIFSVSQNDCFGPCQCENCKKIVTEEGSEAGPLIRFVNAVASEVGKLYPDKLIDTLAYQYTKDPPKLISPAANVRVRLCPIENCQVHAYETCPNDAHYVEILKGWNRVTDNLYIWHYNTNFGHYLIPFPDWDEIIADIPLYKRTGVRGVFMQGNYSPGGGGEFDELRAYVIAKLLWNSKLDAWAVMDDFLSGYYGKGGPALRKYIDFQMSLVRGKDIHVGIYTGPEAKYFNGDFLKQANTYFDEAEKLTVGDPEANARVKHARLSIKYVDICLKYWWKGKADVNEAEVMDFVNQVKAAGISNISEGYSVDAWTNAMLKK